MINDVPKYNSVQHINWQTNAGPSVPSFAATKDKKYDTRYIEIAKHFRELARLFEELAEGDV